MFFKIDKPKIVAGLKNFFNWRSNSNNRNQTVHIENLTINLYQQPGGAVPEGQIGIQVEPREPSHLPASQSARRQWVACDAETGKIGKKS